jgi:subtilase family serine protease
VRIWASRWRSSLIVISGLALVALAAATAGLSFANGITSDPTYTFHDNTPGFVKSAKDLGPVDPSTVISVTVWLKLHNEAQLDALARSQTQKGNASYHKWINQSQFNSSFAPTAQELNAVENLLQGHKLTVVNAAENNFYVEVSGTVGAIEKAFHVQIDNYSVDGGVVRANTADPSVNGSAGAHIAAVSGMDDLGYHPNVVFPAALEGLAQTFKPLSTSPKGLFFASQCFTAPETHTFTNSDASVTATYSGNRFGTDINSTDLGTLPPCGYQPSELRQAYSMNSLYSHGLTGAGQTVVITDAFGDPTIQDDANVFSQLYGLPELNSSNFHIYQAPGSTNNPRTRGKFGDPTGWQGEITLDVEWVHAMAPGANIALVISPNNGADLDEAVNWAVIHHLGNVVSNSWGGPEGMANPAVFNRVNRILEQAAVQGVDVNFSSGDNGDDTDLVGFKSAEFPNSSPFATSVGGTSLALDTTNNIAFQTGWGTNLTRIANRISQGSSPVDPPSNNPALGLGFQFGAGGGVSRVFAKPTFQSGLPGTMRRTPDVGLIADPFTGVEIIETSGGELGVGVIGGTSLACPVFSAMMAIATQAHGSGLGQAAPLLYGLSASQTTSTPLYDVTDVTSANNVSGSITDASGTTNYSADQLAAPLDGTTNYYSAFYNSPFSTRWFVITFGTDSSLQTSSGWDDVTGVGTPNGAAFVNALK